MAIIGKAKPRSEAIVSEVANLVGCEPAVIDAIIKIESLGEGFDPAGRLIIRPEAHKIDECPYMDAAEIKRARVKGFMKQPKLPGYHIDATRAGNKAWQWLDSFSSEFGEEAACWIASFGAPQIMGFNHAICKFDTPSQMVRAFAESEDAQFIAMGRFLVASGLREACRLRKWKQIARTYNGPKYAQNAYDVKLEQAYESSNYPKDAGGIAPVDDDVIEYGDRGQFVTALQKRLRELGYYVDADGDFGSETRDAVRAFQFRQGITVDGKVGPVTGQRLANAPAKPANTKPVPQIAKESKTVQAGAGVASIGALSVGVAVAEKVAAPPVPLPDLKDVDAVIKTSEQGIALASKILSLGVGNVVIALGAGALIFGAIAVYRRIAAQRQRKVG